MVVKGGNAGAGSVGPAHLLSVAAAVLAALAPAAAPAAKTAPSYRSAEGQVAEWRDYRGAEQLWVQDGQIRPEALRLIELVRTAEVDGLNPDAYRIRTLERAVRDAESGQPKALARADQLLSQTLVAFARDMRTLKSREMIWADPAAFPTLPSTGLLLESAVKAKSLSDWLDRMPWMNPVYGPLREALLNAADPQQAAVLKVNLERAKALPGALQGGRYVLVDAGAARLFMMDNGEVKGTMRVIVGRLDNQTPMMAGMIRYAILNPYWNVPPDLAATRLAPNVLKIGPSWFRKYHYQVLSDWTDQARPIDPMSIDWHAVAEGKVPNLRMRQLPWSGNSMGTVKFMFPNEMGIYLHDTDNKSLFDEPARQISGGCVRLQDARKLAVWLFGKPLKATSAKPEQRVAVPKPVPVYITYLTAAPENGEIAYRDDFYNRDGFGVHGTPQGTAAKAG